MPTNPGKLTLADLDLRGRRLLLRADLNAPLANGRVGDDSRLRAALPAIRAAREMGAAVVVTSHLGRPGGAPDPALSLRPVAERLEELLGTAVAFDSGPAGPRGGVPPELRPGEVLLLENLRFHPGETRNSPEFAAALAAYGDEYVNDAFGAAHRAHASVDACARRFPRAAAGPLLEAELGTLGLALGQPPRPFVAILGGAKVSDKLPVILSLLRHADRILIGGAMTYTFTAARGLPTGRSLVERERVAEAAELLKEHADRLALPTDHCTAPAPDTGPVRILPIGEIEADWMGLDIGPASRAAFAAHIREAATIVWNGPMGLFEDPRFAEGTTAVAHAVAEATGRGATSIVGGGDSLAAVHGSGLSGRISHLSTGGGASLAFLAEQTLPGVEALADA
ncbi:MAG: phosphoglycerate kinase [Acidobacteriota bacterium]|nr:phosphoglycerate kinase [Acidobacteriota bacterium]